MRDGMKVSLIEHSARSRHFENDDVTRRYEAEVNNIRAELIELDVTHHSVENKLSDAHGRCLLATRYKSDTPTAECKRDAPQGDTLAPLSPLIPDTEYLLELNL